MATTIKKKTAAPKSAASKAASPPQTAAKAKPQPAGATAGAAAAAAVTKPEADAPLRRRELVARIARNSGLAPNKIKTVLDAVLEELGQALSEGDRLNLPPLGRITVNRRKDLPNAEVIVCKVRRKKKAAMPPVPAPKATAAE